MELKIALTVGATKNRRLILEFNRFTQYFADTFDIRTAPMKGGLMRYMLKEERAKLAIFSDGVAQFGSDGTPQLPILKISIDTMHDPSRAFLGRLSSFLGAFLAHCQRMYPNDLKISWEKSEVPDQNTILEWGNWSYEKVRQKYPKL